MITREGRLRRYCTDFKKIENYEEAVSSSERYDLHHRKEIETLEDGTTVLRSAKELKRLDLYWHRPPEELIFLSGSEHVSLHNRDGHCPEESREKRSESLKGHIVSDDSRAKISKSLMGRKASPEARAKMSASRSGSKHPMFGRRGEKSPAWKGDLATDHTKYIRLLRQRKREALANSLNL